MGLSLDWVLQFIIITGIGAIGYFLKENKKNTKESIDNTNNEVEKNAKDIKNLEKEFNSYKEKAARDFVHKDDFIRAMTNVDKKLDKIHDLLLKGSE